MTRDELWMKAMRLGAACGCHQRPDRSFFIGSYQFPLCARCTGVAAGEAVAFILLMFRYIISPVSSVILLGIMGLDWFVQYKGILGSTNVRRFITGIMGGLGISFIYINIIRTIIKKGAKRI